MRNAKSNIVVVCKCSMTSQCSCIQKPDRALRAAMWPWSLIKKWKPKWKIYGPRLCTHPKIKSYFNEEMEGQTFRGPKSEMIKWEPVGAFRLWNLHGSLPLKLRPTPKREKNKYFTTCLRAIGHSHAPAAKLNEVRATKRKKKWHDQRM